MDEPTLRLVWTLRRMLTQVGQAESAELLLTRLSKTANNREFLATLSRADV